MLNNHRIRYYIHSSIMLIMMLLCIPVYAKEVQLPSSLRSSLYSLQYSLAKNSLNFDNTIDAIDIFLGIFATRYLMSEDAVLSIATKRQQQNHTSYLYQDVLLKLPSLHEIEHIKEALQSLSPHIKIHQTKNTIYVYINNILTHTLQITIPQRPKKQQRYSYLTILIDDVGENLALLKEFSHFPFQLTYAIWPFASATQSSSRFLRSKKLSTIIHLPMEPIGYPEVAPGNGVLLRTMSAEEIHASVHNALKAVPHAIGINNHMGSAFTSDASSVKHFVNAIQALNPKLYIIDSLTDKKSILYSTAQQAQLHTFTRSTFIDNVRTVEATLAQLFKAEIASRKYGKAIAIGHLAPTTLQALYEFIKKKKKTTKIIPLEEYAQLK